MFAASFVEARDPSVEVTNAVGLTKLEIRAFPNASGGYTPKGDNCPSPRSSVRSASTLSPDETSWVPHVTETEEHSEADARPTGEIK